MLGPACEQKAAETEIRTSIDSQAAKACQVSRGPCKHRELQQVAPTREHQHEKPAARHNTPPRGSRPGQESMFSVLRRPAEARHKRKPSRRKGGRASIARPGRLPYRMDWSPHAVLKFLGVENSRGGGWAVDREGCGALEAWGFRGVGALVAWQPNPIKPRKNRDGNKRSSKPQTKTPAQGHIRETPNTGRSPESLGWG